MVQVLSFVLPAVVVCFLLQRTCRRRMDIAQYNYFRDLALLSVWLLSALWAGSDVSRFIVGMAVFASMAGTFQHTRPHWSWKLAYLCELSE